MLARLFPHPLLTVLLALLWMVVNNAFTLNALVFGVLLGVAVPLMTAAYWPDRPPLRLYALPRLFGYLLIVLWDIVVANFVVARIILFKNNADLRPAWISIPLELRRPEAITMLAGTITMTPGTVSADLSADGRCLLVHCLDAPDPDAVRADIKARYERRLKEIFE